MDDTEVKVVKGPVSYEGRVVLSAPDEGDGSYTVTFGDLQAAQVKAQLRPCPQRFRTRLAQERHLCSTFRPTSEEEPQDIVSGTSSMATYRIMLLRKHFATAAFATAISPCRTSETPTSCLARAQPALLVR